MHPVERFSAPHTILAGSALKDLLGPEYVELLADSLAAVVPEFSRARFRRTALRGLHELALVGRAEHLAAAIASEMPAAFLAAAPLLVRSFGPPLSAESGNGLRPFFYYPHSCFIARHGVADFAAGMAANYELTRRFTAEFSVRPFLVAHRAAALRLLRRWTKDPSPHVRRLVSEGTRPRLPWASRLPEFQADPALAAPLLEALKDDPSLYVRRSVANHLGDVAKDHPQIAFARAAAWIEEAQSLDSPARAARLWIVRHALRHPAKQGDRTALALRRAAAAPARRR